MLSLKQLLFNAFEHVIYYFYIVEYQCLLYYTELRCDTCMTSPASKHFRLNPGLGVWQIGIRAIGYSELVNILNKENPKIYNYSH